MNIIIANTQEFNPQIGGVERVSTTLAEEFVKLGHNVFFVAYLRSLFSKEYHPVVEQLMLPDGSMALCVENSEAFVQYVKDKKAEFILNQAGNIPDFTQLCVTVKERTHVKLITEIHINPDYRIKGYLDRSPSRLRSQSTVIEKSKRIIKSICPYKLKRILKEEKQLYRYVYNNSSEVVLLSEHYKPVFAKLTGLSDTPRLTAISNPLSFQVNSIDLGVKKKQILFVGRLDYGHKRPDRALEIWDDLHKKFPDWELIMLGDGPAMGELRELSNKLKLERISFAGFQDPKNYYKEASIILMTSSIEGLAMVLIEAAQYGVIPVAFDTFESLRDIIDDGVNGYRIPPPFIKPGCEVLGNLMSNQDLRKKMANASFEQTSKFALDKIVGQWLNLLQK